MIKIIFATMALLVSLPLAAEDELTLKDGRVLVGAYDDESGKMTIPAGKGSMTIAVSRESIVSRKKIEVKKVDDASVAASNKGKATYKYKENIEEIRRLFQQIDVIEAERKKAVNKIEISIRSEVEKIRLQTESEFDASPIEIEKPKKTTAKSLSAAIEIEALNKWMSGRAASRNRSDFDRAEKKGWGIGSGERYDYWRLYCDARNIDRIVGDIMYLDAFSDRDLYEIRMRIFPGEKTE